MYSSAVFSLYYLCFCTFHVLLIEAISSFSPSCRSSFLRTTSIIAPRWRAVPFAWFPLARRASSSTDSATGYMKARQKNKQIHLLGVLWNVPFWFYVPQCDPGLSTHTGVKRVHKGEHLKCLAGMPQCERWEDKSRPPSDFSEVLSESQLKTLGETNKMNFPPFFSRVIL